MAREQPVRDRLQQYCGSVAARQRQARNVRKSVSETSPDTRAPQARPYAVHPLQWRRTWWDLLVEARAAVTGVWPFCGRGTTKRASPRSLLEGAGKSALS